MFKNFAVEADIWELRCKTVEKIEVSDWQREKMKECHEHNRWKTFRKRKQVGEGKKDGAIIMDRIYEKPGTHSKKGKSKMHEICALCI